MATEELIFNQLCVWPSTLMPEDKPKEEAIKEFEQFFKDEFNVNVKFAEQVFTLPDLDSNGKRIPNTGGRSDLFFYIADQDISKFAVQRLQMGIRWWEDVIKYNHSSDHLYTKELKEKYPVKW